MLHPIQAYLGGGMDMNRANEARDMTKKFDFFAVSRSVLLVGRVEGEEEKWQLPEPEALMSAKAYRDKRLECHFGREQVQSIVERSKVLEQAERAKKRPKIPIFGQEGLR